MDKTDKVDEFLRSVSGSEKPPESLSPQWDKLISPENTYLVTGDVGTGKSALCYWLLEHYSQRYNLEPCVVGLPTNKLSLIPSHFRPLSKPADLMQKEQVVAFVDEAGIQLPLDDVKVRDTVTNFLALPRQRTQILLLCYHIPRLVLSRYLPFFSAFLLKRPPYLIEYASKSKNDTLSQMMRRAQERFNELVPPDWDTSTGQPEAVLKNTYVVSPRLRWQGMMTNPIASFWSNELSKIWSGTQSVLAIPPEPMKKPELSTEDRLTKFGLSLEEFSQAIEIDREQSLEQLREKCRTLGLPTSGEKKRLIANLLQYWKEHDGEPRVDSESG